MGNIAKPLLIIGTQRSGSNLLRLMLNQLPAIEAPHPPHVLQIFYPLLPLYGNLEDKSNFHQLATDVAAYVNVNPVAWHNVLLTADNIVHRTQANTLIEIFKAVYEIKASTKSASYWCCKSMANVYYCNEIETSGLAPFYIYLERDGRDVAASFKNSIVGEKHVYFIAQQWKKEQQLSLALAGTVPPARFTTIRYEEFITGPQQALQPTLKMLGLQWTDDILQFYLSDEAKRTAASGDMWKNVVKPVDATNMRHYSEKLSAEEILIFEKVAGTMLQALNYALDNQIEDLTGSFSEEEVAAFSKQNDELKKAARKKYVLDAQVRVKQEELIKQIKSRP